MGRDPRRLVGAASASFRLFLLSLLKRYQAELPALLEVDSPASLTMGANISAPLDERRRRIFLGLRRFPLALFLLKTLESQGVELRRW